MPQSIYSVQWTALMMLAVVIGGLETIGGALIGAGLLCIAQRQLGDLGTSYLTILGQLPSWFP
jgi:ABC-type branched-subunit amino acid transport system permease subunit